MRTESILDVRGRLAGHDSVEVARRGLPPDEPIEQAAIAEPIPIAVYAPSVTHLTAIRTALMTNDRAGAIRTALELLGVLMDTDLRTALHAAIAALDEEGRAGVADLLRTLVG